MLLERDGDVDDLRLAGRDLGGVERAGAEQREARLGRPADVDEDGVLQRRPLADERAVVDDDIDIHDYAAVDWAIAWRVNAGEGDVFIFPATWGAGLDPSTRRRDANVHLFGTGKWNRVLIDATMNLDYEPDEQGRRFPPTVWPDAPDADQVRRRWAELGLERWGKPPR